MSTTVLPTIGEWYKDKSGETFEVVAFDNEEGCIEIQYFDGTVEERDIDAWNEQIIQVIEPPEDWSGSLDIEKEDYGVDLEGSHLNDWTNPLDELEQ
jgi:hypothetical protein